MAKFTFREGTMDFAIFCMVYFNNEYQLPPRFEPSDIVIDVGAHIGSFAFATLIRGAGQVMSIETHPENYELARSHLFEYMKTSRLDLRHGAVWRSDGNEDILSLSNFPLIENTLINTGGAEVEINQRTSSLTKIPLDDLIANHHIRLLKIDCEGSEFPILLTSQRLSQVCEIVGEFHEHQHYTIEQLLSHLKEQGFTTEFKRHARYEDGQWIPLSLGYFRAIASNYKV